jgi:hypothetical protein
MEDQGPPVPACARAQLRPTAAAPQPPPPPAHGGLVPPVGMLLGVVVRDHRLVPLRKRAEVGGDGGGRGGQACAGWVVRRRPWDCPAPPPGTLPIARGSPAATSG